MYETLTRVVEKMNLNGVLTKIVTHQGVQDLERSLRIKLPNWNTPDTGFLILRDNDNGDCFARKQHILKIVNDAGKSEVTKVRIVCQELEAWFLGDAEALEKAGYLKAGKRPKSVRGNPDEKPEPTALLDKITQPDVGKVGRAKKISPYLAIDRNLSTSFANTVSAIRELAETGGQK